MARQEKRSHRKYWKIKNFLRQFVVSKQKNNSIKRKITKKPYFLSTRQTTRPVFIDFSNKLIKKEKKVANLNHQLFIFNFNIFKSQNDHKFSTKKLDRFLWDFLGSQPLKKTGLVTSTLGFELFFFVIKTQKSKNGRKIKKNIYFLKSKIFWASKR